MPGNHREVASPGFQEEHNSKGKASLDPLLARKRSSCRELASPFPSGKNSASGVAREVRGVWAVPGDTWGGDAPWGMMR